MAPNDFDEIFETTVFECKNNSPGADDIFLDPILKLSSHINNVDACLFNIIEKIVSASTLGNKVV